MLNLQLDCHLYLTDKYSTPFPQKKKKNTLYFYLFYSWFCEKMHSEQNNREKYYPMHNPNLILTIDYSLFEPDR